MSSRDLSYQYPADEEHDSDDEYDDFDGLQEAAPILREGWMHKANRNGRFWKRRWFVLSDVALAYYPNSDKNLSELKGGCPLNGAVMYHGWPFSRKTPTPHVFRLATSDREFYFACETSDDLTGWQSAIEQALAYQAEAEAEAEADAASAEVGGYSDQPLEYPAPSTVGSQPSWSQAPSHHSDMDPSYMSPPPRDASDRYGGPYSAGNESTGISFGGTPISAVPPAQATPSTAERIKFTVQSQADGKTFALMIKTAKIPTMTGAKIKRTLEKYTSTSPARMVLRVGDTVVEDAWTGSDIGLHEGLQLSLDVLPEPPTDVAAHESDVGAGSPALAAHAHTHSHAHADPHLGAEPETWTPEPDSVQPALSRMPSKPPAVPPPADAVSPPSTQPFRSQEGPSSSAAATVPQSSTPPPSFRSPAAHMSTGPSLATSGSTVAASSAPTSVSDGPIGFPASSSAAGGPGSNSDPASNPASPARRPGGTNVTLRLNRRLEMRRVFMRLQSDPTNKTEAVPRHDFVRSLLATPGTSFLKGTSLLEQIQDESKSSEVTWEAVSAILSKEQDTLMQPDPDSVANDGSDAVAAPSPSGVSQPAVTDTGVDAGASGAGAGAGAGEGLNGSNGFGALAARARGQSVVSVAPGEEDEDAIVLTIDVGNGAMAELEVAPGDDPASLADTFIRQQALDPAKYRMPLITEITNVLSSPETPAIIFDATEDETERSRLVMTVDLDDKSPELSVRITDDPEELAERFVQEHQLDDEGGFKAELVQELRKTLLQGMELELQFLRTERNEARAALADQYNRHQSEVNGLKAQIEAAAADIAALKAVGASTAPVRGRPGSIAGSVAGSVGADLDKEFTNADANNDGLVSREEWRTWAKQKKEMLERFNSERARLTAENKRLRAALDPMSRDVEARFCRMDEERAHLSADLAAAQTARSRVESELSSVVKRWEADGRKWAAERKRLSDQVESLAAAVAASDPANRGSSGAASSLEVERLKKDHDMILRNWSEETEILVTVWREDKQAWAVEREGLQAKVASLQSQLESSREEASRLRSSKSTADEARYASVAAKTESEESARHLDDLSRRLRETEKQSLAYQEQARHLQEALKREQISRPSHTMTPSPAVSAVSPMDAYAYTPRTGAGSVPSSTATSSNPTTTATPGSGDLAVSSRLARYF